MEYTCCICESKYDKMTGDTDERMCHKCMDEMYDIEDEISTIKRDNRKDTL